MAVGGISQFINPVIDSMVSDKRSSRSRTFTAPARDFVPVKILAIGDENCLKDQLLLNCACNTSGLDSEGRAMLKRPKYCDICTQFLNVQCQLQLLDTSCEMIYNRLRYKAYGAVDCVALCYRVVDDCSFSSMCASWIDEVRFVSRTLPIVSVRIISGELDCNYEVEQHWVDSLRKGCRFHLDCHLDRYLEVETFLNMASIAGLHKLGYRFQDGRIVKKGHNMIKSIFGLSTALPIPLPIPFLKQKELTYTSLNYKNKYENLSAILNDKASADVVFVCGKDHYYCHKLILCSRVQFFRELFCVSLDGTESVNCSGELFSDILNTTSLFKEVSIVKQPHSCKEITQITVSEQISPTVFEILINCIYACRMVADESYIILNSCANDLGIIQFGHHLQDYFELFYNCKVFCDVTLVVDDKKFAVHKAVLSARSSVFSAMFSGRYKEGSQFEVLFPCSNTSHFNLFLEWVYLGKSDSVDALITKGLNDETIEPITSLLKLGDEYCIEGLINYSEAKISELISRHMCAEYLSTIPGVLEVCETYNADLLKKWIIKTIAGYFYEQYNNPEVKCLFFKEHQEDIELLKPTHLSFVKRLKSFYLTI